MPRSQPYQGKPFQMPAWRQRLDRERVKRQQGVIRKTCDAMEQVMLEACEQVVATGQIGGQFQEPDLSGFDPISRRFYFEVVAEAYRQAQAEKQAMQGRRKLAASPRPAPERGVRLPNGPVPCLDPGTLALARFTASSTRRKLAGLPSGKIPDLPRLVAFFRDKRQWGPIDKRRKKLIDRLRKAYLEKLRKKFKAVVPAMLSGEKSPAEVKAELMEAWGATRSRVGTIFDTETTKYFCQTQVAFFEEDPDIIGFLFDSIRDTARTPICQSRHGLVFRPGTQLLRKNTPALHWRCRSHLIALADTEYNRKLLADPQRDPERRALVPLPKGWKK